MSSPFRKNAVQALASSGESRERTSLVTPRRALVALAVIALLLAGVLYVAVNSLATPTPGIGWADRGGFAVVTAPVAGTAATPTLTTGTRLRGGDVIGEVTDADGATTPLTAPGDSIVMQRGAPTEPFAVAAGDPVVTLGMLTQPPLLFVLLPGIEATGLTDGSLSEGAKVWVQPANGSSFECRIVAYNKYEQSGESIIAYIPSPTVARYVQANGSVVSASASCPDGELDALLVGSVVPVSVEVGRRSLLSYVFGGS